MAEVLTWLLVGRTATLTLTVWLFWQFLLFKKIFKRCDIHLCYQDSCMFHVPSATPLSGLCSWKYSSHTLQHFLQFTQTLNSSLTDCMHRYFSNKSLSLPYKSSFPLVHLKPHLLCGAITLTEQGGCVVRNSTSPAFSAKETCEELICYVHSLLMFFPKI